MVCILSLWGVIAEHNEECLTAGNTEGNQKNWTWIALYIAVTNLSTNVWIGPNPNPEDQ